MCWFLYGAANGDIDEKELDKINSAHRCRLTQGTKHELKTAVLSDNCDYRITAGFRICDCESEIGTHHTDAVEVIDFAALLNEICALPGAKTVSFCKTWVHERNKRECQLVCSQTDLRRLLADLEPRTLYTINCQD